MADCGSSGSVLDRTARNIFLAATTTANGTDTTNNATKQVVSSLLGHVSRGVSNTTTNTIGNPLSVLNPPEELILIQNQHHSNVTKNIIHTNNQQFNANNHPVYRQQQQQQQQHHPQHVLYHPQQQYLAQPQYNMHTIANHAQSQQQQQQQQFLMQQQQQYQMMMMMQQQQQQQQQHFMMLRQQQQQMVQANAVRQQQQIQNQSLNQEDLRAESSTSVADVQEDGNVVVGHDGIVHGVSIEELSNAWREATISDPELEELSSNHTGTAGHEGIVNDLTMNQLSAAWAEANDEYEAILEQHQNELQQQQQQEEYDNEYYDNNLWTGDGETGELTPYEFIHKLSDELQSSTVLDNSSNISTKDPINWMETGMEQFNAGNIKDAIRSFEMELQINNNDNAIAWRMLGKCHAENDMDREAIICFEHSVDRDPYCTESLLALGVSYVNELNHTKALQSLKAWITHNPKFATIDFDTTDDVYGSATTSDNNENSFDEVQRLLLKALEFVSLNDTDMDSSLTADVLEALGVVYNVSRDYDAAVQSFQKAVKIRPNDYQLWNKLGATLANSNQSSEALPAYHKALQIKPKYARAWLNMAISHSNLHNYNEAARCYLQTLSLNRSAVHCWSYLRIALSCAEQWDLIPAAAGQDIQAFVNHYDFIMYEP